MCRVFEISVRGPSIVNIELGKCSAIGTYSNRRRSTIKQKHVPQVAAPYLALDQLRRYSFMPLDDQGPESIRQDRSPPTQVVAEELLLRSRGKDQAKRGRRKSCCSPPGTITKATVLALAQGVSLPRFDVTEIIEGYKVLRTDANRTTTEPTMTRCGPYLRETSC